VGGDPHKKRTKKTTGGAIYHITPIKELSTVKLDGAARAARKDQSDMSTPAGRRERQNKEEKRR